MSRAGGWSFLAFQLGNLGVIAEEVGEVFPELVAYGPDGQPETVRYHFLPPLLLNEVQRQQA